MQTYQLAISDPNALLQASALLLAGEVIAAPTDTVYGVMCRFDSSDAIERLYIAKARPPQKAIPVLIGERAQMAMLTPMPISAIAIELMDAFWPGALTLILPALPHLPANLTAGQNTVAIRMPDHDWLRSLIRKSGPLAATSANLSGRPEAYTAAEVLAQLEGRIPLLLVDEHESERSLAPSTIVDLSSASQPGGTVTIVREGPLGEAVRERLKVWHMRASAESYADRN